MLLKIVSVLFVISCFSYAGTAAAPGEDLGTKLGKRVAEYNLGSSTFGEALLRVSNDFQIPMGIAWAYADATSAKSRFAWKDTSVREIIKAIVKTQPGYEIEVANGIVHVFAPRLIPDGQNFLKLRIDSFSVKNTYVELASFRLHALITPQTGNHQFSVAGPGDSKVDLELRNSSLEEILDALVAGSNRKIWIMTFSDDNRLNAGGLRRTRSLWTDVPLADSEQPLWLLMRWGDPAAPAVAAKK